ncbi:MAG: YlxR family protein [Deltaproteobacteria bacterium]
MVKTHHRPQRTCIGCGMRDLQEQLIRVTLADQNRLIRDAKRGRGGYLHRNENWWRALIGRKGQYRAFHREVSRAAKEQLILELQCRNRE